MVRTTPTYLVSFVNGKKAFDTNALIDPGSQFTFKLEKITNFLALPFEDQEATTLQYLNTEHDMPLSKISEKVTVAPYKNLDQKFQITTTYSIPCLNLAPANTFDLIPALRCIQRIASHSLSRNN